MRSSKKSLFEIAKDAVPVCPSGETFELKMTADACHRCGRRTAFRFWSFENGEKVPFCTWFCARTHHLVSGKEVVDDGGKVVIEAST